MEQTSPTQPSFTNTPPMSTSRTSKIPFIISSVIIFGLGLIGGWYLAKQTPNTQVMTALSPTPENKQPTEPAVTIAVTSPTATLNRTMDDVTACNNSDLKLTLKIPKDWTCDSKQSFITLKSDIFTINISNLGRGGPCGNGPEAKCTTSDFYKNDIVTVNRYDTDNNESGKAFFGFTANKNWIDITYTEIANRELTEEEKTELFKILDSIEITQ